MPTTPFAAGNVNPTNSMPALSIIRVAAEKRSARCGRPEPNITGYVSCETTLSTAAAASILSGELAEA